MREPGSFFEGLAIGETFAVQYHENERTSGWALVPERGSQNVSLGRGTDRINCNR